jgi:hypothetical protein
VKGLSAKYSAHEEILKSSIVDHIIYSVYTGCVLFDKNFNPYYPTDTAVLDVLEHKYTKIRYGQPPCSFEFSNLDITRNNIGFGLGQTIHDDVSRYLILRNYNSQHIKKYGIGMLEFNTPQEIPEDTRLKMSREFREKGIEQLLFTVGETKLQSHQVKLDWESIREELIETKLGIEHTILGASTTARKTLLAEVADSKESKEESFSLYTLHVQYALNILFPNLNIKFVDDVDSVEDIVELSQVANVDEVIKDKFGDRVEPLAN